MQRKDVCIWGMRDVKADSYRYTLVERLLFPRTYINERKLRARLRHKTVLITGASSGIGEATAYALAHYDVHLILVARSQDKLLQMKAELEQGHTTISVYVADMRVQEELAGLITFLHTLPNGLDIVVSNAGKSIRRPLLQSLDRMHDFTRTMAINYFAPVELLLAVIPLLQKSGGHIINVSTVNALLAPVPHWAAYQASKGAFDVWFRSAAPELHALGIRTTSLYLPLVRTPMITPTTAYDTMPAMHPRHVAMKICKAFMSKRQTIAPWWIGPGLLASVLLRRPLEYALSKRWIRKGRS